MDLSKYDKEELNKIFRIAHSQHISVEEAIHNLSVQKGGA